MFIHCMNGCDVCYFGIADTATHPILTEFAVMDHKSDSQVDTSRADWVSLYAPRFDIPDNWDEQLEQSPPTECGNDGPFNEQSLEHKQGVYCHTCPDSEAYPTFPYGPLLRACGSCEEPIPMSCAFCERVSEQPCNTVYRVALTGADWHGFRSAQCPSRETGVLVKCTHCDAPGEFHIHLALFKGYYSEVLDLVREGRISLFDVRRSVNVVAEWPPHPDRPLIRLISHLANELSASLAATPLPNACGALVFAYWQGAGPDYLLEETTFTNSFDEMYACNHGWPCLKDDGSRQYCLWTQWAQQWIHELVVCDGRAAIPRYYSTNHLPRMGRMDRTARPGMARARWKGSKQRSHSNWWAAIASCSVQQKDPDRRISCAAIEPTTWSSSTWPNETRNTDYNGLVHIVCTLHYVLTFTQVSGERIYHSR